MNIKIFPLALGLIIAACDNGIIISPKPDASETRSPYVGETYAVIGSITDAGGMSVAVTLSGTNGIGSVPVNADGGYNFFGVRPGSYVITPSRDGAYFVPATQSISVVDSNVTPPPFEMRRAMSISGSVSQIPTSNVKITLSQEGARDRVTQTDATLYYSFTNLLPGKYTVTPQAEGFTFDPPFSNMEATTWDFPGNNFRAIPANRSIYGKILGATTAGVTVNAIGLNGNTTRATTVSNAAGEYSFQGLKPGAYEITPVLGNFIFIPSSFAITIEYSSSESQANFISSRKEIQCNGGWCTPWDVENYELVTVRGLNSTDIWTSGARSALLHYAAPGSGSQAAWFPTALNTGDVVLAGIWGSGAKDVWMVGSQGLILRNLGNGWINVTSPTEKDLNAIWGSNASTISAVGAGGTIIRYIDGGWEDSTPAQSKQDLNGIWASKSGAWWAVGANGTILSKSGPAASWVKETSSTTKNLNAVWGKDHTSVWAVGDKGTILQRTGNVWRVVESGTDVDLFGVWAGATDTDVWAVGTRSTVLRYGPFAGSTVSTWNLQRPTLDLGDLRGVWSAGDGTMWLAGNRGIFSYKPLP